MITENAVTTEFEFVYKRSYFNTKQTHKQTNKRKGDLCIITYW